MPSEEWWISFTLQTFCNAIVLYALQAKSRKIYLGTYAAKIAFEAINTKWALGLKKYSYRGPLCSVFRFLEHSLCTIYPFFLTDLDPLVYYVLLQAMSVIPKLNGAQRLSGWLKVVAWMILFVRTRGYYPLFLSLVWLVYTNHHLLLLLTICGWSIPIYYLVPICPKSLIYLLISLKEKVGAW